MGGDDLKQTVKLIMNKLLRRSVSLHYSYMGRKGKSSFCELKLCKAVLGRLSFYFFCFTFFALSDHIHHHTHHHIKPLLLHMYWYLCYAK